MKIPADLRMSQVGRDCRMRTVAAENRLPRVAWEDRGPAALGALLIQFLADGSLSFDSPMVRLIADLATEGGATLDLVGMERYLTTADLSGDGALELAAEQLFHYSDLDLAGLGELVMAGVERYVATVDLSGSATLSATGSARPAIDLGLTGSGAAAFLIAGFEAAVLTTSSEATLTVDSMTRYLLTVAATGEGALIVAVAVRYAVSLGPTGSGTLTTTGMARYAASLGLTGAGTLSTAGFARPAIGLNATGSGALSLAPLQLMATALGLTGAGTLAMSGVPGVAAALGTSGAGTLAVTGLARYASALGMSGAASLAVAGLARYLDTLSGSGSGSLTMNGEAAPPTGITFVSSAINSSGNTVTIGSHQTGDLIIVCAGANGSTAPSLPSGWTNINNQAPGFGAGSRCGYKVAGSSSESSGTWTNANVTAAFAYRNAAYRSQAGNSNAFSKISYPALSGLATTDWVLRFGWASNSTPDTPAGYTTRESLSNFALSDTGGEVGATSVSAVSADAYNVHTIAIKQP